MKDENKEPFKLEAGKGEGKVFNLRNGFAKPVHVAVICPPQAAVTALLNTMGEHGGIFVLMIQMPLQVGGIVKGNGQPNIQLFPMLVFAIQKEAFETWLSCTYDPNGIYQMEDVMNGRVVERG